MAVCDFSITNLENAAEGEKVPRHGGDKMECGRGSCGCSKSALNSGRLGTSVWYLKGHKLKGIWTATR